MARRLDDTQSISAGSLERERERDPAGRIHPGWLLGSVVRCLFQLIPDRSAGHERNMLSIAGAGIHRPCQALVTHGSFPQDATQSKREDTRRKSQLVISQPSPSQPSECGRPIDHDLRAAAHRPLLLLPCFTEQISCRSVQHCVLRTGRRTTLPRPGGNVGT